MPPALERLVAARDDREQPGVDVAAAEHDDGRALLGAACVAPDSSAATPTAPAPSTTSLAFSISITIASAMSSSATTTTSSTHSRDQRQA